jgi:hypothetical protein
MKNKYGFKKLLVVAGALVAATMGFAGLDKNVPRIVFSGDFYELYKTYPSSSEIKKIFVPNSTWSGFFEKIIEIRYQVNEKPEARENRIKTVCGVESAALKQYKPVVEKTADGQLVYWKEEGNAEKYMESSFNITRCTPNAVIYFSYTTLPGKFKNDEALFAQWVEDMRTWTTPSVSKKRKKK